MKAKLLSIFVLFLPISANASKILKVDGQVFIMRDGKKIMVSEGTEVQAGEKVCTEENSYALISLFDGSELEMRQSTCITLEESEESPAISLFFGRIINRVAKIFGTVERYEVHTLTSVAGVKGTVFSVTAGEDGSAVFEVDEGEIEIEAESDESYSVKDNEAVEVSEDGKISKRKPFSSDEERTEWLKKRKITDERLPEFLKNLERRREVIKERLNESIENLKKHIEDFEKISEGGGDLEEISLAIERERRKIRRGFALLNGNLNISFRVRERLLERGIRISEEIPFDVLYEARERFREVLKDKIDTLRKARRIVRISNAKKIWNSLPDEMKEKIRKNYRRWKELPPERRALIIENWRRFRSMPPERRKEIMKNYKRFKELPEPEKRRVIEAYKHWRNLPPEKKRKIIENYRRFKKLPPEKRKEILNRFRRQEGRQ